MNTDWEATPHALDTNTAEVVAAADHIRELLPHLSNNPNSVLPVSALRGTTFEQLISHADRDAIHALIRRMQ